jgi:uncharacterized membrane protein YhaH (DUF805 family)
MSVVHSYFGFSGRINRAKFWLLSILLVVFSVIAWIVALLAAFLITGLALTDGALPGLDEPGKLVQLILDYAVAFLVLFGVTIAIWVSYLAIGVKRLHDRDRSGWWIGCSTSYRGSLAASSTSPISRVTIRWAWSPGWSGSSA